MLRSEWLASIRARDFPWMNDVQWECYMMVSDLFGGPHHLDAKVSPSADNGIRLNIYIPQMSTFDGNRLTRAVFMAHDRCIRLELCPSGPNLIKFLLHKRECREGGMSLRHPTLAQALADYRVEYPEET